MLECALYQKDVKLKGRVVKSLPTKEVNFYAFRSFNHLSQYIQQQNLDLIVIAARDKFENELRLVKKIRNHSLLSLVPILLCHPLAPKELIIKGFRAGADEFVSGKWDTKLVSAKLKMIIDRSQRDLGVNPSTRLPGTELIEKDISRRIKRGEQFAACYVDLDNFKAYNDYYGYIYADSMILMTSKIIREIVYREVKNSFVGHIGGDDFIFIIPFRKVKPICTKIIETFDRMVVSKYKEKDLMRGYIVTKNRKGEEEKFPIMTISIGVVVNKDKMFTHIGQISRMITDLKNYAKSLPGSNYVIERRKRY